MVVTNRESVSDLHSARETPRSVYVHVPFCRHRCGYCNFSLVSGRDHLIEDFLQALEIEIDSVLGTPPAPLWKRGEQQSSGAQQAGGEQQSSGARQEAGEKVPVDTIYLGGGTPSYLSEQHLRSLLIFLEQKFELQKGHEFTIEINPDDLPGPIESVISHSPINRISLGVQSFDSAKLRSLDRIHNERQVRQAINISKDLVDRISIDLIFGAEKESLETWQNDLQSAIDCGAGHISTYELTIERGTQFWNRQHHGRLAKPEEEQCADFYEQTISALAVAGFEHYEISSFALPGQRSSHNQIYWMGKPYWAFGPGASSFVNGVRKTNHRSVTTYLRRILGGRSPIAETQRLSPKEIALDRLVFGLRRLEGINTTEFKQQTGYSIPEIHAQAIDRLIDDGFLVCNSDRLRLSKRGIMFCDYVCQEIISAE